MLQALTLDADGKAEQAAALRAQSLESAVPVGGALNGTPFEWIADADSRLGPIMEVVLEGGYYWIPFERIQRIVIEPPADARDLIWLPAQIMWTNGGEAIGFLPARYPGSEAITDNAIRLGRKTEWRALGGDQFAGWGQRVLTTDAEEVGLLELRELTLAAAGE
jgi:type VI secretion system protein ImpE